MTHLQALYDLEENTWLKKISEPIMQIGSSDCKFFLCFSSVSIFICVSQMIHVVYFLRGDHQIYLIRARQRFWFTWPLDSMHRSKLFVLSLSWTRSHNEEEFAISKEAMICMHLHSSKHWWKIIVTQLSFEWVHALNGCDRSLTFIFSMISSLRSILKTLEQSLNMNLNTKCNDSMANYRTSSTSKYQPTLNSIWNTINSSSSLVYATGP